MMRVLVTGGNGGLGRGVVRRLREAGHEVLIGTRNPKQVDEVRFDLAGAIPDLDGVDTVVHLASSAGKLGDEVSGSEALFQAAARSGVGHVVFMSIVGVDRHPFPYYRAKIAIERSLESAGVPWTVFRSTQFHTFIPRLADTFGRLGFVAVPSGIGVQPIDQDTVADRLVELVEAGPSGRVPDLGGPEVLDLKSMARDYLRATGRRTPVLTFPAGGKIVAAFRRGEHHTPNKDTKGRTYRQYLDTVERRRDPVGGVLRASGLILGVVAAVMLAAPALFHSQFAGFGILNTHFIRDAATFAVPLAVALWLSADRPSWRRPVLALGMLQNGFHLVNHIVDVANTQPAWHGPVNLALLAVFQLAMWMAWRATSRVPSKAVRVKVPA